MQIGKSHESGDKIVVYLNSHREPQQNSICISDTHFLEIRVHSKGMLYTEWATRLRNRRICISMQMLVNHVESVSISVFLICSRCRCLEKVGRVLKLLKEKEQTPCSE